MQYVVATKRPIPVHAIKLDSFKLHSKVPGWFFDAYKEGDIHYSKLKDQWTVETLEGRMTGKDGDYLIRGVRDELYICKGKVFEETYDYTIIEEEHYDE